MYIYYIYIYIHRFYSNMQTLNLIEAWAPMMGHGHAGGDFLATWTSCVPSRFLAPLWGAVIQTPRTWKPPLSTRLWYGNGGKMAEKWLKNDENVLWNYYGILGKKFRTSVECTIRQQNMITPTSTFPVTSTYLQNFLWCLSLSMLLKTNIAARQISVPPGWNPAFSAGLSVEQFPMS